MTPLENKCLLKAADLHGAVTYGGGGSMLAQILGTRDLVERLANLTQTEKRVATAAVLLHKCFEKNGLLKIKIHLQ